MWRIPAIVAAALFATPAPAADWAIALHGGAGVIERASLPAADDAAIRADLAKALEAGSAILKAGGSATDAVVATVSVLEASPWFNAGVGAVFTSAGTIELDAAVMDGASLKSGAVTGVKNTQSPVGLARTLMANGPHVFLAGAATDEYAREQGLAQVPNSFFMTERRRRQLQDLRMRNQGASLPPVYRMGTVGAVARDANGNLAAATSTGGLTGKAPGRVGDTPVIGAGTLADNGCGAVSATGTGEVFIRVRAAARICDAARFGRQKLQKAADDTLIEVKRLGGDGGVIVMGQAGDGLFSFNSAGMYRARASATLSPEIKVYRDE
ncbi:MAG: isoaspartyl peptidase/L-asparaginase [Sphingomonas sp.]|nr:MAG: isoaspartyl peptidase/L-asparaginase [Sphingomonas sp.]